MMRKVVITGARGYIGRALVGSLANQGYGASFRAQSLPPLMVEPTQQLNTCKPTCATKRTGARY
jgi:NAD(P)-dependent dehydrogenase (short-subunit alcohol dehydrogenase family)